MTKKILPLALCLASLALNLPGVPQAQAGSFLTNSPMIAARAFHTATLLRNGKVLVAGGNIAGSAELYDLAKGTWTATGAMNHARSPHAATLLPDGKVLVVGGANNSNPELYDPATGKWLETGAPNHGSFHAAATLLPNGKVLVSWLPFNGGEPASAELFDPASGTWTTTGAMRTAFGPSTTASLLPNGQVLLAGAFGNIGLSSTSEIYNPATGSWTTITNSIPMSSLRSHTANLLYNGKVLFAGIDFPPSGAQIYNPASRIWSAAGSMPQRRSDHTATLLPDGKVFVVGGNGMTAAGLGALSSAELYDPASAKWTLLASHLATERYGHTATLLPNGKVLIAGGLKPQLGPSDLSSTELYDPEYDKDMLLR